MKKKFILYNTIIAFISLSLVFAFFITQLNEINYLHTEDNIKEVTKLCKEAYLENNDFNIYESNTYRITIIDKDGQVIRDNNIANLDNLENHLSREEIQNALNNNPKAVKRFSNSLNKDMMYYAEKVESGDDYVFIRIAMPLDSIKQYVFNAIPFIILIYFLAIIIAVYLSIVLSKKVVKPLELIRKNLDSLNNGTYQQVMPHVDEEEINKILNDINDISEKMNINMARIKSSEKLMNLILNNVTNGIITFDNNLKILLINSAAQSIFKVNHIVNKSLIYLTSDQSLINTIEEASLKKDISLFYYEINDLIFSCMIKPVNLETYILVLSDITEIKNNEKYRSEFFANASHELKTPLTSIMGFADLVELQNKDESLNSYISNIKKQSERMLNLITDMLKLSKLESTENFERSLVNLNDVLDDVLAELKIEIKEKNINIIKTGNAFLMVNQFHIYELIKNLVENAVKYNNINGKVLIDFIENEDTVTILVKDNGIGIDEKYQNRIFERFYRVDKSRSRQSGGTGLGLAIVKHVCEIYQAKLILNSKENVGTEIKVIFKKIKDN